MNNKSFYMLLIVLFTLTSGILLDLLKNGHMTQAVETMKSWIESPLVKTNEVLEENLHLSIIQIKKKVILDAPVINQFPELPRGCEVTSLAMLLQYAEVNVDKMTLAKEIKRDNTNYKENGGKIYFGNPNDGFVGDMYSYENPGLGVYHLPITELAEKYLPGRITDLTGSDFDELKTHLSDGRPVWVITNTAFKKLANTQFQTWTTPTGIINITYKEHSVLVTGYDKKYIYFNDPLTGEKNKKAPIEDFKDSWVQMGKQAITFLYN